MAAVAALLYVPLEHTPCGLGFSDTMCKKTTWTDVQNSGTPQAGRAALVLTFRRRWISLVESFPKTCHLISASSLSRGIRVITLHRSTGGMVSCVTHLRVHPFSDSFRLNSPRLSRVRPASRHRGTPQRSRLT